MLNQSIFAHSLRQSGLFVLILGLIGWLAPLLSTASRVRTEPNGVYDVTLGPLLLHTISKHSSEDAGVVEITMEAGLLGYTGLCLAIALMAGWLLWLRRQAVRSNRQGDQR